MNTQNKRKPILLVDFDGVIHSYTSGWQGANVISDPPNRGARDFLAAAVDHFHVNVYSSRTRQEGGLQAMQAWCRKHFGDELVDRMFFPEQKPAAFLTIDDRCICFNGNWPTVQAMLDFQPWYKGDV